MSDFIKAASGDLDAQRRMRAAAALSLGAGSGKRQMREYEGWSRLCAAHGSVADVIELAEVLGRRASDHVLSCQFDQAGEFQAEALVLLEQLAHDGSEEAEIRIPALAQACLAQSVMRARDMIRFHREQGSRFTDWPHVLAAAAGNHAAQIEIAQAALTQGLHGSIAEDECIIWADFWSRLGALSGQLMHISVRAGIALMLSSVARNEGRTGEADAFEEEAIALLQPIAAAGDALAQRGLALIREEADQRHAIGKEI